MKGELKKQLEIKLTKEAGMNATHDDIVQLRKTADNLVKNIPVKQIIDVLYIPEDNEYTFEWVYDGFKYRLS